MDTVFNSVGPYEIVGEIGRGGMATVFLAIDTRSNRRVALKLVPTGNDREAREIVEAERWGAQLQERFCAQSRFVPEVYEHSISGGYFYIAMEYLEGQNLSDVIAAGPLAPERAIDVTAQLCGFLEAAHSFETSIDGKPLRSLVHGDLKPRNIRVLDDGQIKVLDFGIAKALSLSRKVTRNDFGTFAYLSPEWFDSGGNIDRHVDLWAIGVLLYEMVSGVQPFTAPDTRRLEQCIRSRRPPMTLDGRCSKGLQAVCGEVAGAFAAAAVRRCESDSRRPRCAEGGTSDERRTRGVAGDRAVAFNSRRVADAADSDGGCRRRSRRGSDAADGSAADRADWRDRSRRGGTSGYRRAAAAEQKAQTPRAAARHVADCGADHGSQRVSDRRAGDAPCGKRPQP